MDCEGYMAALAHNVLKMARKLSCGVGPPVSAALAAAEPTDPGSAECDAEPGFPMPPQYRLRQNRLTKGPRLRVRRSLCRRR